MNRYINYQITKKAFLTLVCFCYILVLNAQEANKGIQISGKVLDMYDHPVSGAKVFITDYASTFSNDSGLFTISVPSTGATLQIEANGYQYREYALQGQSSVQVKLFEAGFKSLFGKMQTPFQQIPRSNATSSSAVLNTTDVHTYPVETPETYMQGKIAGLNTIMRSGMPGSGANLFLRGYNSLLLNTQPLIVVDGMIYQNMSFAESQIKNTFLDFLSSIDVRDIESISILKDATSIYGAKASNGVILITTKHCTDPVTKINFSAYGGFNYKPELYPVMEAEEYKTYASEMLQSAGYSLNDIQSMPVFNEDVSSPDYYRFHNNTNWQKEVFNNSSTQNYYLNVNGGDNIAKYNLSIGYGDQNGIIKSTGYSRFNTRFNADIAFSKRLNVLANLGFAYIARDLFDDGISKKTNPLYLSLVKPPFLYPFKKNESGEVSTQYEDGDLFSNPVSMINKSKFENRNNNFFGSVKAVYDITKNVNLSSLIGVNYNKIRENVFIPGEGIIPDTSYVLLIRQAKNRTDQLLSVYNETKINYSGTLSDVHNISANLGFRIQSNKLKDSWGNDFNSANDESRSMGLGDKTLAEKGGSLSTNNWASIFANIDYNFYKKYFLSMVVETDGSSNAGEEADGISLFSAKFGLYPSVGAAWLVSSESFMSGLNFIDLFKLRFSYGLTGNDALGNYWNKLYYTTQSFYSQSVILRGNILNPELTWETVKKTNAGIDIALLDQRVSASFDYYKHVTGNMITLESSPVYTGFANYYTNGGSMKNTGYEVELNTRIINRNFKWDLGFNIAAYKNKLTKIPDGQKITNIAGANIISAEGQPVGLFYGYKSLGVFASDEEAAQANLSMVLNDGKIAYFHGGDMHFNDAIQDNVIDANDMDVIGDPNPDFTGGISTSLSYKGITLSALFTFIAGNDVYNYQRALLESMSGYENQTKAILNRWRADGQITDIPKAVYGDPMGNARFSDRWIEDGSFTRLKTLSLSYDLPIKKGFFKHATIYATGINLITWTNYKGFDPEFSMGPGPLQQGIDYGLVPQYKSVIFGINVGL